MQLATLDELGRIVGPNISHVSKSYSQSSGIKYVKISNFIIVNVHLFSDNFFFFVSATSSSAVHDFYAEALIRSITCSSSTSSSPSICLPSVDVSQDALMSNISRQLLLAKYMLTGKNICIYLFFTAMFPHRCASFKFINKHSTLWKLRFNGIAD